MHTKSSFMRVVSLFAGCGGLDLGLIKSGHKIVLATDNDKDCKKHMMQILIMNYI